MMPRGTKREGIGNVGDLLDLEHSSDISYHSPHTDSLHSPV
jgi:hypothetical protein